MSPFIRNVAALFLSLSLASFGAGCITEESFEDEDMEELEADEELADEEAELIDEDARLSEDDFEQEFQDAIENENRHGLPRVVRRPGSSSEAFTGRRAATEVPELSEEAVDPHPYVEGRYIDAGRLDLEELVPPQIFEITGA